MKKINSKILDFLARQRVCALTTLLSDGTPHASAMHFSHNTEPFKIYIQTENTSKKCQALLEGNEVKASVVIGFSEEEFKTLQMDGFVVAIKSHESLLNIHKIHYKKITDAEKWKNSPATVFLVFTPTWWRYTEYKPKMLVVSSEK